MSLLWRRGEGLAVGLGFRWRKQGGEKGKGEGRGGVRLGVEPLVVGPLWAVVVSPFTGRGDTLEAIVCGS